MSLSRVAARRARCRLRLSSDSSPWWVRWDGRLPAIVDYMLDIYPLRRFGYVRVCSWRSAVAEFSRDRLVRAVHRAYGRSCSALMQQGWLRWQLLEVLVNDDQQLFNADGSSPDAGGASPRLTNLRPPGRRLFELTGTADLFLEPAELAR